MAAAQLGRPAKGLPRYYMDVGWYNAPRFLGLPLDTLFVFEAVVGYCTKHATDGRLPGHHEDLAAALGLRASAVKKALPRLIERGALERTADGLEVRGWADHNPTAVEVEEHSRVKGEAGRHGNHVRWHVRRGVTDPNCPWCDGAAPPADSDPPESPPDRTSDRTSDPNPIADPSLGMGWDGIGEPTSSDTSPGDHRSPDDDDHEQQQPDQGIRVGAALGVLAGRDLDDRQAAANQPPVGDPNAWTDRAYDQRKQRHGAHLQRLAHDHPDATADELADLADPPRPAARPDPLASQQAATLAAAEAGMAHVRALADIPVDPDGAARMRAIRQAHRLPGAPA